MSNIVPATQWQPPEAKKIKTAVNIGLWLGGISLAAFAVTRVVPTWIDALALLQKLTSNIIYLGITAAVLFALALLLMETFTKDGKINKLFAQWYNSVINRMTWAMLEVDPISPLEEEREGMLKRKSIFDEAFSKFDGMLSRLAMTEANYRTDAKKAEGRAKAAHARIAEDPTMATTFKSLSYEAGRYQETADNFAAKQAQLRPVRDTIKRLRDALLEMVANIDIDIKIARDEWDAQQSMAEIDKSARGILERKQQLALNARQVIQDKYAQRIGQLENLKDITKPLLDSIDLDKGTYSAEFLAKWQSEANVALQLAPPSHYPQPMQVGVGQPSKVGSFIR